MASTLPNLMASSSGMGSFCLQDNERGRRFDALTSSLLGCYLSKVQLRKILRRYHQKEFLYTSWMLSRKTKQSQAIVAWTPLEGASCHGVSSKSSTTDICDETRKVLDSSIDSTEIVQALHETARMFQVAIEKQKSLTKGPLFTKAWLGIDHNAWIKSISYQAAVIALFKATLDISGRTEGNSLSTNSIMQQSLLHLSGPLEESIQQQLLSRDPAAETWFWYQQQPVAVTKLVGDLEKHLHSSSAIIDSQDISQLPSKHFDVKLFTMALTIFASIIKLGPGKLSNHIFTVYLLEETSQLMGALIECLSIEQVYQFTETVGLRTQFLKYFGPRAAQKSIPDFDEKERTFWIGVVQKLLKGAMTREGVLAKLPPLEGLEQDLAVFGFFAALGRRARSLLGSKRIHLDDPTLSFFRYLEGGAVAFYPQLATLTTYQLFVEVASEELTWIPFFEETMDSVKDMHDNEGEALAAVLNICSCWVDDFMLYSDWIMQDQSPATRTFLSNVRSHLYDCVAAMSRRYRPRSFSRMMMARAAMKVEQTLSYLLHEDSTYKGIGEKARSFLRSWNSGGIKEDLSVIDVKEDVEPSILKEQLEAFDKDLKTVEEVLFKLEELLEQSKLSNFRNGSVHLTAIQISLQKLKRLKREAEALKATLKDKTCVREQRILNQILKEDAAQTNFVNNGDTEDADGMLAKQTPRKPSTIERTKTLAQGLTKKLASAKVAPRDDIPFDVEATYEIPVMASQRAAVSKEFAKFEDLQRELFELDLRIRACTEDTPEDTPDANEDSTALLHTAPTSEERGKAWEILSNSTIKLKNATMDVLKGTQLLATDVTIAVSLLKSSMSGHKLTERERKVLRRTCTDLASVIPIGILMLLPVTAVGHAAILAAIQKYVPGLIPSAYSTERLDLLKQLEQLRKMDAQVQETNLLQLQNRSEVLK